MIPLNTTKGTLQKKRGLLSMSLGARRRLWDLKVNSSSAQRRAEVQQLSQRVHVCCTTMELGNCPKKTILNSLCFFFFGGGGGYPCHNAAANGPPSGAWQNLGGFRKWGGTLFGGSLEGDSILFGERKGGLKTLNPKP